MTSSNTQGQQAVHSGWTWGRSPVRSFYYFKLFFQVCSYLQRGLLAGDWLVDGERGRGRLGAGSFGEVTCPGREAAGGKCVVLCGGWAAKRCGGAERGNNTGGFGKCYLWSNGEDQIWGEGCDWVSLLWMWPTWHACPWLLVLTRLQSDLV